MNNKNYVTCFTCEAPSTNGEIFILYQCILCKEKTAYCSKCAMVVSKILSEGLFKCSCCKSINKAISKEEIIHQAAKTPTRSEYNVTKTPSKIQLSSFGSSSNVFLSGLKFTTPRSPVAETPSVNPFENDFCKKIMLTSPEEESFVKNPFASQRNDSLLSSYQILSSKRRVTPTKKKINLMNKSFGEVKNTPLSEFSGYNKKKITSGSKIKRFAIGQEPVETTSGIFSSTSGKKIEFCPDFDENGNNKKISQFGVRCDLKNAIDTPHKFFPQLNPNSFNVNK